MDGAAGYPSSSRQSHERLCPLEAGVDRRWTDDQTVRRRSLGTAHRHAIHAGGSVPHAARCTAHTMGTASAISKSGRLEPAISSSRTRPGFTGEKSRDLCVAWEAPRGACYRVEEKDGLVAREQINSLSLVCWFSFREVFHSRAPEPWNF